MLCVSSGRAASFIWYLQTEVWSAYEDYHLEYRWAYHRSAPAMVAVGEEESQTLADR